jgi:release factor glutamine methyltransferase
LNQCEVADASVDAWLLLEYVTGIGRTRFLLDRGKEMPAEERNRYGKLLQKRGTHIPLQHLTGVQEFMGLEFQVNEHVLIPRQDTEILVEEALKYIRPGMQILDLCTGSGCIGISLAKLWPGGCQIRVDGSQERRGSVSVDCADISEEALKVAEKNAEHLGAEVQIIHSDLFQNLGIYDMIVSNPPYIPRSVYEGLEREIFSEPEIAFVGGEDGLVFYERLIPVCLNHLKEDGFIAFEIGYDQGESLRALAEKHALSFELIKDYSGLDRVVILKK